MKFTKQIKKLKSNALSIIMAIAMMLSANFSSICTMANYARYTSRVANAIYNAKTEKSFNFASSDSLTTSVTGNSSSYVIDRDASIIDAFSHVKNGEYFPIVKYNGFSALSEFRSSDKFTADQLKEADPTDNYYGVISTDEYQVARKDYKKDGNNFVFETTQRTTGEGSDSTTETVNVVYVSASKKSGESDESFATRVTELKALIASINKVDETYYIYLDTNTTTNERYDSNDYASINTDSDAYETITADFKDKKLNPADEKAIDTKDYKFYNKKTYEFVENTLAIKTNGTITLTNNSYYVVSVWVYTAGPDTTATLAVTGTNLNAKIENISTNGLWVQYYLFIETPAQDSTNITVNLYYGDNNGVTGTRSLQSFVSTYDGTTEEHYKTNTITGTVAFDQLKIDSINQFEFVNQTINGYKITDIAKANLSDDYKENITTIKNNKKATATTVKNEETNKDETSYTYEYATFASNDLSNLAKSSTYSARFYNSSVAGGYSADFQNLNGKTNADLVYNFNTASTLDYNTYLANGTNKMFSYYMPRYTADDNTTVLTTSAKQAYRERYQNSNVDYTTEELTKYGTSQLWATVVAEDTEFEGYEKDKYDEFGNKVENEDKETEKIENVHNNTFVTNPGDTNYILKLENKSSYNLGLTSTPITMPASSYYRVSVWAYSTNKEAIATAKLFTTVNERNSAQFGTLVLASATATDFEYNSNSYNGWKEIVFAVQGNPYQTCNLYLSLLASENDTVYFDNIKVENISSSSYSSASNKLNLADKAVLTSKVTNGLFNNITVSNADPITTYPYAASSWTIDSKSSSESVVSGVVNTNEVLFKTQLVPAYNAEGELDYYDQNYITLQNDGYHYVKDNADILLKEGVNYLVDYKGDFVKTTTLDKMFDTTTIPVTTINDILKAEGLPGYASNYNLPDSNVYAVYLPEPTEEDADNPSFLLKSSNISSLSSNSVVKLTFQVWIGANFNGKVVANLVYDSKNITNFELDIDNGNTNIATETWQTFTIYIRTGNTSRSSISLQLGATESTGTLFFQNVNYSTLSEKTNGSQKISVNDQFDTLVKNHPTFASQNTVNNDGMVKHVRFVDLHNNNFTMHSTQKDTDTYLYDSYSYTLPKKEDKDEFTQGTVAVVETGSAPAFKFDGQDVTVPTNPNTTINTALLLKNEETTDYTVANSLFNTTLSTKKYYKITFFVKTSDMGEKGLKVTPNGTGLTERFENINTTSVTENGGWEQYTMYVSVGASSISNFSLSFTLGTNDKNSFEGWALVSNITLTEIEETEYTTDTEKDEIKNDDNVIIEQLKVEEEEKDETTEEEKNKFQWATFFLVLSSVLLVVALVIALVAVLLKKKAKKNALDAAANGGIESSKEQETGGIE